MASFIDPRRLFSDDPRTSRRQTAKKEKKKCTRNSFTGSFIRGIKNERLARMETGSVCRIGFLDVKRSVVSNLRRPFSIRSRCTTENRHYLAQTTGCTRKTHLVTMNFPMINLSLHNSRREFKKKKRVEFREESRRSLLRSI